MKKALLVALLTLAPVRVFAHELMFNLEHRHNAHYYENIYHQEYSRARQNYIVTGDRKYMEPYLGWYNPNRYRESNRAIVITPSSPRRSRSFGVDSLR
jgi:hypothetical protein